MRWTCSWLNNKWNFASSFLHLLIASCSRKRRYQAPSFSVLQAMVGPGNEATWTCTQWICLLSSKIFRAKSWYPWQQNGLDKLCGIWSSRPRIERFKVYVPHNLGICTTSRLHCSFSESRNYMPSSRLHSQTWDCARCLRNLGIAQGIRAIWDCASAICKRNGLTGWERLSWKIVESSPRWWCLERGHSTGLGTLCTHTQTEGKRVSLSWQTSRKPLVQGLEYTCPTLMVTKELQELITYVPYLCTQWKLEGFNCAGNRIVRSRDCAPVPRDLEIGTQFPDSENAQCNLEIAQIPRLHGTYIPISNYYK